MAEMALAVRKQAQERLEAALDEARAELAAKVRAAESAESRASEESTFLADQARIQELRPLLEAVARGWTGSWAARGAEPAC